MFALPEGGRFGYRCPHERER